MLHVLICGFDFRDFVNVFETDGSHYSVAGLCCPLVNTGCLLHEVGGRWGFGYKMETTVGFDSDEGWCRNTGLYVRGSCVELLAKVHGLDTSGTERWAYWWGRGRFPRSNEEALRKNVII